MSLGCSIHIGLPQVDLKATRSSILSQVFRMREVALIAGIVALSNAGCRQRVDPPDEGQAVSATAKPPAAPTPSPSAQSAAIGSAQIDKSTEPAQSVNIGTPVAMPPKANSGDPSNGKFTLEDATKGLPRKGKLIADVTTEAGKLRCELFDDKAPKAVANFAGLARGLRPFKDPKTSEWVKRPGYDGTVFHRIIKGFMIQGGDPTGTGAGEPGYVFEDEVWPGATHDRRGLLCMANRGPNTNGMQFFILDGAATHLDRSFTIFGNCGPDSVIEKLAASKVQGDRAVTPPKISKVTIRRGK